MKIQWHKTAKHTAWLLIAVATGVAFAGYFTPIRALVVDMLTLDVHPLALFWIGFLTLFTYSNAGWLRHQVCPTGIVQYECIGCAACIDACDTTERTLEGKPTRFWRPQLLAYAVALLLMVVLLVSFLNSRVPLDVDIVRDRQTLFESTAESRIINDYNVTLRNQDGQAHRYA